MNDLLWLTLNPTKFDPTPDPEPDDDPEPEPDSEPDESVR